MPEKGESPESGQLFNTSTFDRVRSEKWPAVSLCLKAVHPKASQKKGESPSSGRLFNTSTFDRVRSEKWPTVSLYLSELLG